MITSINEFRKHLNSSPINEMSYASLQGEIDALKSQLAQLFADQELEAGQKGDQWTDEDANRYGAQMAKIERKIETRQNYINRLRTGVKTKKHLTVGETAFYKNEQVTVLSINLNDNNAIVVKGDVTVNGTPCQITNIEGDNIFVKMNGKNFAQKVKIDQIENIISANLNELSTQANKEPRAPKEPKVKTNMEVKQAIRTLTKNMDSVKPSIDKFKDRSAEQQATIFKTRFNMPEDISTIVAALNQMGLITAEPTV